MSETLFQTCGKCGQTGPVRYDNRQHRRCNVCWERVQSDTFVGVTPEQQATPGPAPVEEESEPAATPVKTKKGK